MLLDLMTLRLFVAVYEEQTLTRAAARENISLSALSKRISDLEKSLGTPLFQRARNRLDPTLTADALARHVRRVLADLGQIEAELADFAAGVKGRVRIWSNAWAILQYLPRDLAAFMASHPLVRIELQESLSPAIVEAVAENAADIGVFAGDVAAPGLLVLPYRADRLVVVMPAGHALAALESVRLDDMVQHDIIGPKQGSAIDRLLIGAAGPLGLQPRIRVAGTEAVCSMAAAGLGIGLVPGALAARYQRVLGIHVRPLDAPWAARHLRLCTGPLDRLTPAGRQLLRHLQQGAAPA
jgi:DNA-binding transcriptional LysR family regulator